MYAHTLLGHEWWLAKDYDKALSSFQEAVTINPRHYNAWWVWVCVGGGGGAGQNCDTLSPLPLASIPQSPKSQPNPQFVNV